MAAVSFNAHKQAWDYFVFKEDGGTIIGLDHNGDVLSTSATSIHVVLDDIFSDAAAGSLSTIVIAPGNYDQTSECTEVSDKSFIISGYGATITGTSACTAYFMRWKATPKAATLLTANTAVNDTHLHLTDLTDIDEEDMLLVSDDQIFAHEGGTYNTIYQGEMTKVAAKGVLGSFTCEAGTTTSTIVQAGFLEANDFYNGMWVYNETRLKWAMVHDWDLATKTLTLNKAITDQVAGDTFIMPTMIEDSLYGAYLTASNASAVPITPITIKIYGLTIIPWLETSQTLTLRVLYGHNIEIKDCHFEPCGYLGVEFAQCYNVLVDGNFFSRGLWSTVADNEGYGVACGNACRNVVISNNHFWQFRHCIVVGYYTAPSYGISGNILVVGNTIRSNSISTAIDAHLSWDYVMKDNFIDCLTHSTTSSGSNIAIGTGSKNVMIDGNYIRNCQYLFSTRSVVYDQNVTIRNNRFEGCDADNAWVVEFSGAARGSFPYFIIENNDIINCAGIIRTELAPIEKLIVRGNLFHYPSAFASASTDYYNCAIYLANYPDVTIDDNVIDGAGHHGMHLRGCKGTCRNNTIKNPGRSDSGHNGITLQAQALGLAAAGTDTTHIVTHATTGLFGEDDSYNGMKVYNSTRTSFSIITDWDKATQTLTISPAIAAQTNGDTIYLVNNMIVEGNRIDNTIDSNMAYGIREYGVYNENVIRNNTVYGAVTGDYLITGTYTESSAGTIPSYDYIVNIVDTNYIATKSDGTQIASNADLDDTLNTLFTTAASGSTIVIAPGAYTLNTNPTTVTDKSFDIYAYGATITTTSGLLNQYVLRFTGTAKASTPLTVDTAINDNHVHLTSLANVVKGDLLKIYDDTTFASDFATSYQGELTRVSATGVLSVGATFAAGVGTDTTHIVCAELGGADDAYNGMWVYNVTRSKWAMITAWSLGTTTMTLDAAIASQVATDTFLMPTMLENSTLGAYTVLQTATAIPITPITVNIYGLTIVPYESTAACFGIRISYGSNCTIKDCVINPVGDVGIAVSDCYNTIITGNTLYGGNEVTSGLGIVVYNASRNTIINANSVTDCRHAITYRYSVAPSYGLPAGIIISNNVIGGNGMSYPIEAYFNWDANISNNVIDVKNNTVDFATDSGVAVQMGCKNVIMEGNIIRNAILAYNTRSVLTNQKITVRNNKFYGSETGESFIINMSSPSLRGNSDIVIIEGNELRNATGICNIASALIEHLEVRNNLFYSLSTISLAGHTAALTVINHPDVWIEGNTIFSAAHNGIECRGCKGIIHNNKVINPGRNTAHTAAYGIEFAVSALTIVNDASTDTTHVHTSTLHHVNNAYNGMMIYNSTRTAFSTITAWDNTTAILTNSPAITGQTKTDTIYLVNKMVVEGNWIEDNIPDAYLLYGVHEGAVNNDNIVRNNTIIGDTTGKCLIAGTYSVASGNSGYIDISELRGQVDIVLEKLGTPRLLCPCNESTGTSITDYTRNANTVTASASVATWHGSRNRITYYDFDGAALYMSRADDPDFTFGNSLTDSAFSVVALVSPDDVTSRTIVAKWNENTPAREWRLYFDANGYPSFELYDESADTYIGREDQTAFATTMDSWRVLIATYDGSATSAGCKIYIDGVQVDDADSASGAYVAMEDGTSNLYVGCQYGAAVRERFYDGKMTWICIAAKELSADEVWSLTQRLKGLVGV